MANNIETSPSEAAGPLSCSRIVETESITEETTTTTTTTSGTETVNVTVTKIRTRTTKTTETTSQQPTSPLSSAHVFSYSPAPSLAGGQTLASNSSATPTRVRAALPHTPIRSPPLLSEKSRVPASNNAPKAASSVPTPPRVPPTPKYRSAQPIHPNNIKLPTTPVNEFYVVVVGQEPGIFYSWNDAAARVLGVSKNVHFKCSTFQEALRRYKDAYYCNEVKCVPNPGTRYHSQGALGTTASSRSTPCEESSSDVEYWRNVDDLSEEISKIRVT
ncbi:hypothetical protein EDD15DRAFT_2370159 [Pisolithus albus]|nr:hypothetical protein EDD15DRAFT_2370159 [Pisolithus albus]